MPRDLATAAHWYRLAVDKGVPFAFGPLGRLYLLGAGVEGNLEEAASLFRKAAEWEARSQYMLAMMVLYKLVDGDAGESWELLKKSAARGYPPAQYQLAATLTSLGRHAEALPLYEAAVARNYPPAQNNLGAVYARGLGVAQDFGRSMELYKKAADKGHPRAMSSIGAHYAKGEGVKVDWAEALKWFTRAAEAGFPEGYLSLGVMYSQGKGVARDDARGYFWFRLAADAGYPLQAILSDLEKKISPEKLAETKGKIKGWQAKHRPWSDVAEFIRYGWY